MSAAPRSRFWVAVLIGVGVGLVLAAAVGVANNAWADIAWVPVPIASRALWANLAVGLIVSVLFVNSVPPWTVVGAGVSLLAVSFALYLPGFRELVVSTGFVGEVFFGRLLSPPTAYVLAPLLIGTGAIRLRFRA